MVIAVNTGFTAGNLQEKEFIAQCFAILAASYPQHQFIFIGENIFEKDIHLKNITQVNLAAAPKNSLLLHYQLNYKIPSILRKHKATVFVSSGYCSLRTRIPQCLIVHDLPFLQQKETVSKSRLRLYKNSTLKFVAKAKHIVTTSQCLRQQIIDNYKIAAEKITVAYYGVNKQFAPLDWQLKDAIKGNYTAGKEYFLYTGTIEPGNNLVILLKAFSFFKKRQKSNMQLLLATKKNIGDKDFLKNLASYKYREEVRVLENVPSDVLAKVTGAAYALVNVNSQQGFCLPAAEAIQSEVPVITRQDCFSVELCGDAAIYINPGDFNDIAEKMMLLFKNEDKRNEVISKGRQRFLANDYHWNKTAALLWESIERCAK